LEINLKYKIYDITGVIILKKGINIWSFPSYMDIRRCIDMAKEAGFECIELSLSETGELMK
jgi:L-ribulose-5-phosphate 3-epimerase UlaE